MMHNMSGCCNFSKISIFAPIPGLKTELCQNDQTLYKSSGNGQHMNDIDLIFKVIWLFIENICIHYNGKNKLCHDHQTWYMEPSSKVL